MIILDTNVVSAIMSPENAGAVAQWVDNLPRHTQWLTATVVAELSSGIEQLPPGRRRNTLATAFEAILHGDFAGRILPFDTTAAIGYGAIVAQRRRIGRPISVPDAQIAAVCMQHGATLATRNVRDFEAIGIDVCDPWTSAPGPSLVDRDTVD